MALDTPTKISLQASISTRIQAESSLGFPNNWGTTVETQGMKKIVDIMVDEIFNSIIANLEIKGIKVDATSVVSGPTPPVITPTDGGASLLLGLTANSLNKKLTQSNDGIGRVA